MDCSGLAQGVGCGVRGDPQGVAESVVATALGYGGEAWARILEAADRVVVAKLLGMMMTVVPGWVNVGLLENETGMSLS